MESCRDELYHSAKGTSVSTTAIGASIVATMGLSAPVIDGAVAASGATVALGKQFYDITKY